MVSRRYSIAVGMAFGIVVFACCGPAMAIDDLGEAFTQALARNPEIAAARADFAAAQSATGLASTASATRVFADGRIDAASRSDTFDASGRFIGSMEFGVNLARSLYDSGRVAASVRAFDFASEATGQRLRAIEARVLYETVEAYISLLAARERLAIRQDAAGVLQAELAVLAERLEAFDVTATDIAVLETAVAEARILVDVAREALEESRIAFRLAVGLDASRQRLTSPRLPRGFPASEAEAIERATTRNPLVTAAMQDAAAFAARTDVARLETAPSIDFVGRVAYRAQTVTASAQPLAANAGIRISVPLFDGGAGTFRQRNAREQSFAAEARVHQAQALARARVASAWQRRQRAGTLLATATGREAAARETLQGMREEAFLGQRTASDVANAIRVLSDARDALVATQFVHAIASFEIVLATGDLAPDSIAGLAGATPIAFRTGAAIPMPLPPPPAPAVIPLPPSRETDNAVRSRGTDEGLFTAAIARLLRPGP